MFNETKQKGWLANSLLKFLIWGKLDRTLTNVVYQNMLTDKSSGGTEPKFFLSKSN